MNNLHSEELIEEIRINNDIVDVVSEYVKLDRKGKDYFGLCPFHKEKTPSFSVVPTKQIFYCFGCGKGGNVFHFVMNAENLSYIESIKLLADRAKIILPEGEGSEEQEKAKLRQEIIKINTEAARLFFNELNESKNLKGLQYLRKRGIKENTIKKFGIGYTSDGKDVLLKYLHSKGYTTDLILKSGLILPSKNGEGYYDRFRDRIIYPIFDVRGNVIGFGGRVIDNSMPKYMNSPETLVYNKGRSLYALNFAKNSEEKRMLVVEGYMDVISLHQSGIINTVASLGTALTESQGRILKKYAEEIIISYDADTAGQSATMRGLDLLSEIGCNVRVLTIQQGKDPDEFIKNNGIEEFKKLIDSSLSLVEYKIQITKKLIDTDSIEGKIKFLNSMSEVLSKLDNLVEREMYIKKFSNEYGISEESIYSEIIKKSTTRTSFKVASQNKLQLGNKSKVSNNSRSITIRKCEKIILAILCLENSIYKIVSKIINTEFFENDENKTVANIIFSRLEKKQDISPAELLSLVDIKTANEFTGILQEECNYDDNNKAILDLIKSIKGIRLEMRQNEILEILSSKDKLTEGNVEKLKLELNSILMQKKNIW